MHTQCGDIRWHGAMKSQLKKERKTLKEHHPLLFQLRSTLSLSAAPAQHRAPPGRQGRAEEAPATTREPATTSMLPSPDEATRNREARNAESHLCPSFHLSFCLSLARNSCCTHDLASPSRYSSQLTKPRRGFTFTEVLSGAGAELCFGKLHDASAFLRSPKQTRTEEGSLPLLKFNCAMPVRLLGLCLP